MGLRSALFNPSDRVARFDRFHFHCSDRFAYREQFRAPEEVFEEPGVVVGVGAYGCFGSSFLYSAKSNQSDPRIEREFGRGMRTAGSFEAYEGDIAPNNRPGRLSDYQEWFAAAGMTAQILHLHGNVALIAGAKSA